MSFDDFPLSQWIRVASIGSHVCSCWVSKGSSVTSTGNEITWFGLKGNQEPRTSPPPPNHPTHLGLNAMFKFACKDLAQEVDCCCHEYIFHLSNHLLKLEKLPASIGFRRTRDINLVLLPLRPMFSKLGSLVQSESTF